MKIPGVHTQKLDDRSRKVINLGREPGTKGYRLLDPTTNRIFISRDVVFDESKAWIWDCSAENEVTIEFTVPDVIEINENENDEDTDT